MVIGTVDSLVENKTKAISIFIGFYLFKIDWIHKPYTALQIKKKKKKKIILCMYTKSNKM